MLAHSLQQFNEFAIITGSAVSGDTQACVTLLRRHHPLNNLHHLWQFFGGELPTWKRERGAVVAEHMAVRVTAIASGTSKSAMAACTTPGYACNVYRATCRTTYGKFSRAPGPEVWTLSHMHNDKTPMVKVGLDAGHDILLWCIGSDWI